MKSDRRDQCQRSEKGGGPGSFGPGRWRWMLHRTAPTPTDCAMTMKGEKFVQFTNLRKLQQTAAEQNGAPRVRETALEGTFDHNTAPVHIVVATVLIIVGIPAEQKMNFIFQKLSTVQAYFAACFVCCQPCAMTAESRPSGARREVWAANEAGDGDE